MFSSSVDKSTVGAEEAAAAVVDWAATAWEEGDEESLELLKTQNSTLARFSKNVFQSWNEREKIILCSEQTIKTKIDKHKRTVNIVCTESKRETF